VKILVLGAGGVGGYFGGRLVESGSDITFLVRDHRRKQLIKSGLRLNSPHGDFSSSVKCKTLDDTPDKYDLVILSCKSYHLTEACVSLRKWLNTPTCILPFLNGLSHIDVMIKTFGEDLVFGGAAHVATTLSKDGHIVQLNPIQVLTVGPLNGSKHLDVLEAFVNECRKSSFSIKCVDNVLQPMWEKWVFLATLAGSTVLFRNSVGAITETKMGNNLMQRMYDEGKSVAMANDINIPKKAQITALDILMKPGSDFTASMLRDLVMKLPTEHDHILGGLVELGKCHDIDMPLLSAAYVSACANISQFRSDLVP
jgi:2-dehydropantoate 2-reductase